MQKTLYIEKAWGSDQLPNNSRAIGHQGLCLDEVLSSEFIFWKRTRAILASCYQNNILDN